MGGRRDHMRGKRHKAEEIVVMVREAEAELAKGVPIAELARKFGVSEWTLNRWRHRYGGLGTPEAKRLRELERENTRLKKVVAEQALDKAILQEALKGKF